MYCAGCLSGPRKTAQNTDCDPFFHCLLTICSVIEMVVIWACVCTQTGRSFLYHLFTFPCLHIGEFSPHTKPDLPAFNVECFHHTSLSKQNPEEKKVSPEPKINVCMRFWAKDPEPQNQSTSLTGLNTEPVLPPDEMNAAPFSYSFPPGIIMDIIHQGVSENGSATFS